MAEIDLVLAPIDCSEESARAAEYALAVADRYGAAIHFLHVVEERLAMGLESGDVEAEQIAAEYNAFAEEVDEMGADKPGVEDVTHSSAAGFTASRLSRTPGSVVLDTAEEIGADFVVIPRERPSGDPEETLGKAALYVLEYASQPVLSV